MKDNLLVFSGNGNKKLANDICEHLGINLADAEINRFADGEISLKINQNVRGHDVFIIQPICSPSSDNLMELLIMVDALKRASAHRITSVLPYFGYARQDRKDQPRVPITAKLVANLLVTAGTNRVLTIDLHAQQIQGFFDIPLDHLYAFTLFANYVKELQLGDNIVVISPDVGGIKTARAYANRLECDLAVIDKRRMNDKETKAMHIMGDIKGKIVLLVDDMVSTASSLLEAVGAICEAGVKDIYAMITHPILCGPAIDRLKKMHLKKLVVTDTIPLSEEKRLSQIEVLSVAPLLSEAIKRIHKEESISVLFD